MLSQVKILKKKKLYTSFFYNNKKPAFRGVYTSIVFKLLIIFNNQFIIKKNLFHSFLLWHKKYMNYFDYFTKTNTNNTSSNK